MSAPGASSTGPEWFAQPDAPEGGAGLRFSCTMCGNCCTGPEGYILVNDEEIDALAKRLGITRRWFIERYTKMTDLGRSIAEKPTPPGVTGKGQRGGLDCVFLDRDKIPGRAVCGVYEDRPRQCRTWPFWNSVVGSRSAWERAKRVCPGMDKGTLVPVQQVRVLREVVDM